MSLATEREYPENVIRCLVDYGNRRRRLLDREAAMPVDEGMFGANALTALATGGSAAAANAVLRRCAEWFEHPVPDGLNGHQGECDFAAIKLCRAWHLFKGGAPLEAETLAAMRVFFTKRDFASLYQSENHAFLFHTARHLMAQAYSGDIFEAYGKIGSLVCAEDGGWLRKFLCFRAGHGWGEFDSPNYIGPVWECLACLYDFSKDGVLQRHARMMMDLLLADMAVDSLRGMYCGAHGRIYPPYALDHATEPSRFLQHLYLGEEFVGGNDHPGFVIDALTCSYRPSPVIVDIALNRTGAYENKERKHLHNLADVLPVVPLTASLRKYTYVTPSFVLGCVSFQDPYPCETPHHNHYEIPVLADQRDTVGYAHHQQHEWDLSFSTRTDARLFTHHPGMDGTHNHWTGDRLCGCGHFFQNRQVLVALYDIPETQPLRFIHAYVPRSAFDEVVEENGWIFVRAGDAFAGLWLSSVYCWTTAGEWAGREVICEGLKHAVVCEVGTVANHGGFTAFRHSVATNLLEFDRKNMGLTYRSHHDGILRIDTRGLRFLNGEPADMNYLLYDSPWLCSAWGSQMVELKGGAGCTVLDFK